MIITTQIKPSRLVKHEAKTLAKRWNNTYHERKKRSLRKWLSVISVPIYVVGSTADKLYHPDGGGQPFYFHPSMSWIRVLRLQRGEKDPMVDAMQLEQGMTVLDGTMGLASDSIVASYITGETGKVVAIEKNPFLARIVGKGLFNWEEKLTVFNNALKRVQVNHGDSLEYLKRLPDQSFDIVYLDPMFQKSVDSVHLEPLRYFASYDIITKEHMEEALRTARKRIVVKSPYPTDDLEHLGFTFIKKRRGASVCYAVIEKDG